MFLQLIIAVVSAVIFSGLFAGYTTENTPAYHLDYITMASFLFATLTTVILGQLIGGNTAKPAKKKPKAAKPATANNQSSAPSVASDADRELGSVKWFNVSKGFGFITRENDEDIFVHYRSIRGQGRRRLFEGQSVEFAVIDSDKGLQADDVEIL